MALFTTGTRVLAQDQDVPTPEEIENMADPGSLPSTKVKIQNPKTAQSVAEARKRKILKLRALKAKKLEREKLIREKSSAGSEKPDAKLKAEPKSTPDATSEEKTADKTAGKTDAKTEASVETAGAVKQTAEDPEDEALLKSAKGPLVPEVEDWQSPQLTVKNELALRTLTFPTLFVAKVARKYVPQGYETKLRDRLVSDLRSLTYILPKPIDNPIKLGVLSSERPNSAAAQIAAKNQTDGLLVVQLGLEEILISIVGRSGRVVGSFRTKYKVGEFDLPNGDAILSQRIIDALVLEVPYRGFVVRLEKDGSAVINLGSLQGLKVGDQISLFDFRGKSLESSRRQLVNAEIREIIGPAESRVVPIKSSAIRDRSRIPPIAFVSFDTPKSLSVSATDKSVVPGRWWVSAGGSVVSFGAEATAAKYESRVIRVDSAPFGTIGFGNDLWNVQTSFGSGTSASETLRFLDIQGAYALFQSGATQSAWIISAGARLLMINVVQNPGFVTQLESTNVITPMAEFRYQYVPRGRVRLIGIGEVYWPIYSSGAAIGSLIFAFGGGVGGALQLAMTESFGLEVQAKTRFLRRTIDGQSGIQERQSILGASIIFSF